MKVLAIIALCLAMAYGQSEEDMKQFPELMSGFFEGDIVLNGMDPRNGLIDKEKRWPRGTIPIMFAPDLDDEQKNVILTALYEIMSKTCIKFAMAAETTESYVYVQKTIDACFSAVGKSGGRQVINLGESCYGVIGTVIHEFLHTVGFFHEQSRTDRDEYVRIEWDNIMNGTKGNFQKYEKDYITDFGVEYDYGSVMHYPRWAFSYNGEDTIIPTKDPSAIIGQREGMSPKDIEKVNKMYEGIC